MTVRLGLARGAPDPLTDSLLEAIALAAEAIEVPCAWLRPGEDEPDCDVMVVVGAPRSYKWYFESSPRAARISWFGEPLPRPAQFGATLPHRKGAHRRRRHRGAILRTAKRVAGPVTRTALPGFLGAWREAATIEHEREDNLAMAAWCRDRGARIVVTSRDRATALAAAGIQARVVPFGYHPRHAGPLTPPDTARDVAVVVVGSGLESARLRRGRILARLRPGLRRLGRVVEIDGRWGDDRDAILRRARVVLDIQRVPGNFTGLRWLLASAAGTVYVGEPMDDPDPFQVDVDHVEAPADGLIAAVAQLLENEPRRQSMAEASQRLLLGDLAMHRSLSRVLAP